MSALMPTPLRVLLIEDDDADALLITRQLSRMPWTCQIERISQLDELVAALAAPRWELVIADYMLPGFDGLIATEHIRRVDRELPVIIVSGMAGEELAVQAMQAGAHDYLLKTRMERLESAIRVAFDRAEQARQARRNAEALAESEARLRLALDAAHMVVWEWDVNADVLRWSGASLIADSPPQGQLSSGQRMYRQIHPDDRQDMQLVVDACLIGEQEEFNRELRLLWGAHTAWVMVTGRLLRSSEPLVWKFVGTATNINARKSLERQLSQSQNVEGLGRLASGVAHDFNNLLTILLGYLSIARVEAEGQPGMLEVLGSMREASEAAAGLTQQLLGFARRQRITPRRITPEELLYDASRLFQGLLGSSIQLDFDVEARSWPVKGDPSQLQQVLLTLLINARDAMPEGGLITLRARNHTLRAYSPELGIGPGSYVAFSVIDQGVGIRPELLAHLFEPFYNVEGQEQGTGLGLATAHGIITQHGGAMHAASGPGPGATLTFFLPRYEGAPGSLLLGEPPSALLLVVDEHAVIHQAIAAILHTTPHRALYARSAAQALQMAAVERPALLLTELLLPDSSGPALAEALTRADPALRVLYMSAWREQSVRPLLTKPFNADVFLSALSDVLRDVKK